MPNGHGSAPNKVSISSYSGKLVLVMTLMRKTVPANLARVDIDDLLEKAELFYRTNVEKLKFAETGQGKSFLDRYKMEIYLLFFNWAISLSIVLSDTEIFSEVFSEMAFADKRFC